MKRSPARNASARGYRVQWLLLFLFGGALFVLLVGCTPSYFESCPAGEAGTCEETPTPPVGVQSCDLHTFDETSGDSSRGICIPHLDAGWHTALVKTAPQTDPKPQCPAVAEWAGLVGEEIPPPGMEPRHIVGCSVFPLATCASINWACIPFAAGYTACVLKDDQNQCEGPYKFEALVTPEGGGDPTIVCCAGPDPGG